MIPSPHELTYFIELAHTLNFSRASERIGISQPSLSNAIKRLEQSIGVTLFIRSKTGVTLTQAGKTLLAHTKELLQLWENVKNKSLASHDSVQGSFSLGCHPSIALHILSGFLPKLLAKHPLLEIQLKHDISRKILEGIINLSIDIGLVVNPIRHPDLIIQKLYDDKVTFWQSKDYTPDAQHPIIICDPELAQTQFLLKQIHQDKAPYQRIITSSNLEVIANLTAGGAGIGILPSTIALSAHPNQIKIVPKMPFYEDEICLVYRHENRPIKAIQAIVNAIKSDFK